MSIKRKSKKSNITVSISWVFMTIVGVFFIVLAYQIIGNYKDNKEVEYQIELKNTLRNILNKFGRTAGIEENSLALLGNIFRDSKVEIICNDGISLLSINDDIDANNNYLQNYPVFMTNIDQGKVDNTYLAIESFRMPFKITNLLAIVSKKNLIVIDRNSDFGKELYNKFRIGSYSDLNIVYLDFSNLNDFDNNYVKGKNLNSIVFVTDFGNSLNFSISDFKIETYVVRIEEEGLKYGKIHYEDQLSKNYNFSYYDFKGDLSLQTMAVFSNPSTFECSYNNLFKSTEAVYNFYINKSEYFGSRTENICISSFDKGEHKILYDEIRDTMVDLNTEIKNNRFINPNVLDNSIILFEEQNLRLEANSCPYIY